MTNILVDLGRQTKQIVDNEREFSRILTAAVINGRFRRLLLSNPRMAIQRGYGGETFNLADEESERISGIRAVTLADFASQMKGFPYLFDDPS
jgi:hypothetical protein